LHMKTHQEISGFLDVKEFLRIINNRICQTGL
jgi:hypothetical protein